MMGSFVEAQGEEREGKSPLLLSADPLLAVRASSSGMGLG